VWIFVNNFSFIFLEFLAKIYWANFFSRAKNAKKGRFTRDGTGPAPTAGWAGRPGPTGPVGSQRRFALVFLDSLLFDFLLWSENFKGSLNKVNAASRAFLFDYLLAELRAQEPIPSSILLHPRNSHGVPKECRVEARCQGAIAGEGSDGD
jgi:hypothetical protein